MDLTPDNVAAIEQHAAEDYPREACGLVAVIRGRQRYIRCVNAAQGTEHFRIPPDAWAMVEDQGEVVAVVHSHPDAPAIASEHDRVVCEHTGLPWFIASARRDGGPETPVDASEWTRLDPSGYEAPLVGRPFSHGVLDCYSLVRDWYARERGTKLPDFEREDEWWDHGGDLYRQHFAEAGFRTVADDEPFELGDVLLMQVRSPVPNHAAIYVGDGLILQHLHGRLSSRDVFGGYWRQCTVLRVRHKTPVDDSTDMQGAPVDRSADSQ